MLIEAVKELVINVIGEEDIFKLEEDGWCILSIDDKDIVDSCEICGRYFFEGDTDFEKFEDGVIICAEDCTNE